MTVDIEDLELGLPELLDPNGMILSSLNSMQQNIQGREKKNTVNEEDPTGRNEDIQSSGRKNAQSLLFHFAEAREHTGSHIPSIMREFTADFENLLVKLERFCLPLIIVMFERLKFYGRIRKDGEKIEDYFKALEILSEACEFGPDRDFKVKQHFIKSGDINSSLRKLIQESSPLSLKSIFDAFLLPRHGSKCFPHGPRTFNKSISQRTLSLKDSERLEIAKNSLSTQAKSQKFGTDGNIALSNQRRKPCDSQISPKIAKNSFESNAQDRKGQKFTQTCNQETAVIFRDINNSEFSTPSKNKNATSFETSVNKPYDSEVNGDNVLKNSLCDDITDTPVREMDLVNNSSEKKEHVNINCEERDKHDVSTCIIPINMEGESEGEEKGGKKKSLFTCQTCKLIFSDQQRYKDHIKLHICSCEICGTKFAYPSLLERHMAKHTGIKCVKKTLPSISTKHVKKKIFCSVCCLTFRTAVNFNDHMITCCDVCEGNSDANKSECNHIKSVKCPGPKKLKSHRCDLCGATFCGIYELYKHNKSHTTSNKSNQGIKTSTDELALNHTSSTHLNSSAQSKETQLCSHNNISNTPQGIKPKTSMPKKKHECCVCGEKFSKRFYLKNHMRSHSGETPYTCDLCGACFKAQWNLSRHYLVHTLARPHICQICNKSFKWQSTFTSHMKLHQEQKTSGSLLQKPPQTLREEPLHQVPLTEHQELHVSNSDVEGQLPSSTHTRSLSQSQNHNLQNDFQTHEQPLQQQLHHLPSSASYLDQSRMTGLSHPGAWSPFLGGMQIQRPDWVGWP